jgi:hypothetical protein
LFGLVSSVFGRSKKVINLSISKQPF